MERLRFGGGYGVAKKARGIGVSDFCPILDLPIAITHEIFFRLPIKDIIRCKFVCRTLQNLLTERDFFENYATHSISSSLLHFSDNTCAQGLHLLEVSENGNCSSVPIHPKLPGWSERESSYSFIGSSNGLLCFVHKGKVKTESEIVYVSNPIIGDFLALPEHKSVYNYGIMVKYNFGFNPSENNFKVLRFVISGCRIQECDIFTLGVDKKWRSLPVLINLHILFEVTVFNGAFYWIPCCVNAIRINTFDLVEEKMRQISTPPNLNEIHRAVLGVLDCQLILVEYYNAEQITMWAMKKHSIGESWTKYFTLNNCFPSDTPWFHFCPIVKLQNGEILFSVYSCYLMSFNVKEQKYSKIEVRDVKMLTSFNTKTYFPSSSRCTGKLE